MGNLLNYIQFIKKESKKFHRSSFWGLLKYYTQWKNSFNNNDVISEIPWMNYGAIDFLKAHTRVDMHIFEYGSGSSTLFWANRVKEVISIEHDAEWSKNVQKQLDNKRLSNVQLLLIVPEKKEFIDKKDIADPHQYSTDDEMWGSFSFEKYVLKINEYPDNYFDFVVVDGRARPSCIAASANKIKVGGYMVVDNSERAYYFSNNGQSLRSTHWKRIDFCGPVPGLNHFHETSFFKKIK